jgi:phospholipid/cholesterol/gamma-HCH transport system substrate-binding protein
VSSTNSIGRIAAVLALAGAVLLVLFLLLRGTGSSYTVTAEFENASQLVGGNTVRVAGVSAGSVKEISLSDDGQALVEIEVDEEYAPLDQGTKAEIRQQSLSGIANRYVDLTLPPEGGEPITDGGRIEIEDTVSSVDLDQLFNALDERTVKGLQATIRGFARSYEGVGKQANRGLYYLNPLLSTSRRVFNELNSDERALEALIVDGASLSGALASRSGDVEQLVGNLNGMMGAIGNREAELASAIEQFPGFMREFNTTAVNLRAALDDVDPLIDATRPVARKLQPFAKRLRGFARDSVPTVKGLDGIVRRRGAANDLTELTRLQVPLGEIAAGPVQRNGATREGALPASATALTDSLPTLRFFRPYTPELVGWFDDFGHSGVVDANGGIGRISTTFNVFSASGPGGLPDFANPLTPAETIGLLDLDNLDRCPGANERTTPFTDDGALDCDPSQTPVGP